MNLFRENLEKTIKSYLLLVASVCLGVFSSCSDDDKSAQIIPSADSEIYFTKSLDFTSDGGESIVSFTTNRDWTMEASQSDGDINWCTVSPMQGKAGRNTIKVKTITNEGYDDRNITLILTAKELAKKIVITQKQKDALTITTAKYEIGREGGTILVEVKANIAYEILIPAQYQGWIHKSAASRGLSTSLLSFSIDRSEEYDKREGEIIIQSGDISETLKIYQAGGGILLLSKNEYLASNKGEKIAVELSSNFEYEVKMPQVNWITGTTTRGMSSHTLYYTIAPNETHESRETEIVYYDKKSTISNTLTIKQQVPKFVVNIGKAGTLSSLIDDEQKYEIENLVITGDLNGDDIRVIREMAGKDLNGKNTGGKLAVLDLSGTNIISGGDTYNEGCYTSNNIIGRSMFSNTSLFSIILPRNATFIDYAAFSDCHSLTSVVIFNKVSTIEKFAFVDCWALASIDIPYGVITIEESTFSNCKSLTSVTIPNSVRNINWSAFRDCKSLTSINIPNSVTTIGYLAFFNCNNLTSVTIPSGVTIINDNTFRSCYSLTSVTIPNGVKSINDEAFGYCRNLTTVTIPNSVTEIKSTAFIHCVGLTSLIIGSAVKTIGNEAFYGCSNLNTVKCYANIPPKISNAFSASIASTCTLLVPKESIQTYKTSSWGTVFSNIVEMND